MRYGGMRDELQNLTVYSGGFPYLGPTDRCDMWARNAGTSAVNWHAYPASATGVGNVAPPQVLNGVVYYGCDDDGVYALNASTSALIWRYQTGGYVRSTPTVVNGVVYVGSDDTKLYALNASTGALIWRYRTAGIVESQPAVANGMVFEIAESGLNFLLYALDTSNGHLLWKDSFPNGTTGLTAGPAVANGIVYVNTYQPETLYALNASTGATIWSVQGLGGFDHGGPLVANGVVYLGGSPDFYALNASTGATIWIYSLSSGETTNSFPALANGVLTWGDGHNIQAVNATTGAHLWTWTSTFGDSPPVMVNGVVYHTASDGRRSARRTHCCIGCGARRLAGASGRGRKQHQRLLTQYAAGIRPIHIQIKAYHSDMEGRQ